MVPSLFRIIAPDGETWEFSSPPSVAQGGRGLLSCEWAEELDGAASVALSVPDSDLELANTLPLPSTRRGAQCLAELFLDEGAGFQRKFVGYFVDLNGSGLPGRLALRFVDRLRPGRRAVVSRVLGNLTAGAIIATLVQDLNEAQGTNIRVDLSQARLEDTVFAQIVLNQESPVAAIRRIVQELGHYSVFEGADTLRIIAPPDSSNPVAATLYLGQDIANGFSFQASELNKRSSPNVRYFYGEGETTGGGFDGPELDDVEALELAPPKTGLNLQAITTPSFDAPAIEQALTAQRRRVELSRLSLPLVRFRSDIKPGAVVNVQGLGRRFDGLWFCKRAVRNSVSGTTSLQVTNSGGDYEPANDTVRSNAKASVTKR